MYAMHIVDHATSLSNLHEIAFVVAHATLDGTNDLIALIAYGPDAVVLDSIADGGAVEIDTDCSVSLLNAERAYLVNRAMAAAV